MSINSEDKIVKEGDEEKQGFSVSFTNGALAQVEDLKEFFKTPDKLGVIKLAISLLQRAKNEQEKTGSTDTK